MDTKTKLDEYFFEDSKLFSMNGVGKLDFWIHSSDDNMTGEKMRLNNGKPHVVALRYLKKEDKWAFIIDGQIDVEKKMENKPDSKESVFKLC